MTIKLGTQHDSRAVLSRLGNLLLRTDSGARTTLSAELWRLEQGSEHTVWFTRCDDGTLDLWIDVLINGQWWTDNFTG
jgi:hypothetical protein